MLCLTLTTFLMASATSPGRVTKDNAATYLAGTRVWCVCPAADNGLRVLCFMQQTAQQQQQLRRQWQWQRQVLWWRAAAAHACFVNLWAVADACGLCACIAPMAALAQILVCVSLQLSAVCAVHAVPLQHTPLMACCFPPRCARRASCHDQGGASTAACVVGACCAVVWCRVLGWVVVCCVAASPACTQVVAVLCWA